MQEPTPPARTTTVLPFLRRAAGEQPVSGMVAFLFTDIVGSTRRWEKAPEAMRLALARHDAILRDAIVDHRGLVFRTLGDAFMAAFSSPADAAGAAVAAQQRLAAADFRAVDGLAVRMAIYAGIVEARDSDYFGQAPNRTQRLLGAAHGGQILISGAAAEMAATRLPAGVRLMDLGRHRLRDLPEPEHVAQIVAPGLRHDFPPILSQAGIGNLPQATTRFVGRESDVDDLVARLDRARLLTIAGAGGLGKTRLSLEVAARAPGFGDGAWFVELAPVNDPALVAESVCATVGAPAIGDGSAFDRLVDHLRGRRMLIVLDNCEHLVAAAADLAHRILRETTGATILANSREALGVPGEEIWRVGGLEVPPESDDADTPLATAMTYGAVQLFVDRAELAAGGRWRMSQADVAPVVHICQRLDGIPLALELAAARMKMMSARQIAARIGDRFALLTRGARVHLPRQQTLTALYDWSYNLLEPHEQAMFRRLSVFAGGATLERICELCECCGALKVDPFDVVSSLVDKSLVVADAGADEPRYRMVETTRDYAWRKLAEANETHVAIDFARRLARVLEREHALWPHTASNEWFARIAPDVDNLRFALDIAFGAAGDEAVGLDLLSWSARVWDELSLLEERRRWFSLAVTKLRADADPALAARLWFGSISLIAHGDKSNVEPARQAAELFARAGDRAGEGESLARLGAALLTPISVEAAEPWLHAAERTLRALPEGKPLASCLRSMGLARSFAQDIFGALPLIEQSMTIMRSIGDAHGIASAHITLAEIRYALGDIDDSIRIVRELLESGRQSRRQTTVALGNLAGYLLAQDRIDEARLAMIEGLRTARAVGHSASIARLVEHAALMSALTGEPRRAARLLGYGRAFYARGSASREHTEDVTLARASALVVAALRADEIATLMIEGETLGEAEACEIARGA